VAVEKRGKKKKEGERKPAPFVTTSAAMERKIGEEKGREGNSRAYYLESSFAIQVEKRRGKENIDGGKKEKKGGGRSPAP